MKRRKFFKISAPLAMTPMLLNGLPLRTFANSQMLQALDCTGVNERIIVLVQLKGGNDGLNTLVPVEQYATYAGLRPNIKIPDSGASAYIPLDNTLALADQVGLHPTLTPFKELYDAGKMSIIQNVGYPNPDRSHFKSTDLWLSGGDGTNGYNNFDTGWMGRYLSHMFPGYSGNPDTLMPDPLGIQLGDTQPSLGFHVDEDLPSAINLAWQSPSGYFNLVNGIGGAPIGNVPVSDHGKELQYIMGIEESTARYAERISQVFNAGSNAVTYPGGGLSYQFATVGRLISGGSQTKLFLVNIGGFDTHAAQTDTVDPTLGAHTDLLEQLAVSMKAFQDDMEAQGLADKVLMVTFSEFGRKPIENENYGTDHGSIAPMFVVGKGVQGGMVGTNPDLTMVDSNGLFTYQYQYDYRQVFTTLLQDWLGSDDDALTAAYMGGYANDKLPLVAASHFVDPSCYVSPLPELPVTLLYFRAEVLDGDVALAWATETEVNNSHFVVERSKNGINFEAVTEVAGAGTSYLRRSYEALDENPYQGVSYYRLLQLDKDGRMTPSEVVAVTIEKSQQTSIKVFPNPAVDQITITVNVEKEAEATLKIYSMSGQLVKAIPLTINPNFVNQIPVSLRDVAAGHYVVHLESRELEPFSTRLLVK